jgi:hypothetical protein
MAKDGNWVPMGNRIMDRAWLRDGEVIHTGEALLLAVLLHAKGKSGRGQAEIEQVARMLNDPNQRKPHANKKKPKARSGKTKATG